MPANRLRRAAALAAVATLSLGGVAGCGEAAVDDDQQEDDGGDDGDLGGDDD